MVIVISTAVFEEYEKNLTIDGLFFMEGGCREIRLQLCTKSSLCQTPSSSLPLLSRVVLYYDLKCKTRCPVLPILQ